MNILSLFDGISCAKAALEKLGVSINKYYAKEIMINRDIQNDVIYIIRSNVDKNKLRNEPLNPGITLRKVFRTNEIVGITIEDFSQVMPGYADKTDYILMEKFEFLIVFLNNKNI